MIKNHCLNRRLINTYKYNEFSNKTNCLKNHKQLNVGYILGCQGLSNMISVILDVCYFIDIFATQIISAIQNVN